MFGDGNKCFFLNGGLTNAIKVGEGDYRSNHASFVNNLPSERILRDRGRRGGMIVSWAYLWVGRITEMQVVIRLVRTHKLLYNRAATPRL